MVLVSELTGSHGWVDLKGQTCVLGTKIQCGLTY